LSYGRFAASRGATTIPGP